MEYLLKPNDKGRFKIVHRLAVRHQRVGVCVYDPEKSLIPWKENDLDCFSSRSVRIPLEVVRKVENLHFLAISRLTMGQRDIAEEIIQEIDTFLRMQYEYYKQENQN